MASLVHDTLAWLRFYSALPIPLGGDAAQEPDRAATAHLVPLAGAVLGAVGAILLITASLLRLPPFVAATLAVAALVIATGALSERALAQTVERLTAAATRTIGDPLAVFGVLTLVLALFLRVGALAGLIAFGALPPALTLIAACAVSRAATLALTPDFATRSTSESGFSPFQRLALAALVIAAALVLPTFGIGATAAGIAAAVAAAAGVMALAQKLSHDDERPLAAAAEQAAEIAFLLAALIFARAP